MVSLTAALTNIRIGMKTDFCWCIRQPMKMKTWLLGKNVVTYYVGSKFQREARSVWKKNRNFILHWAFFPELFNYSNCDIFFSRGKGKNFCPYARTFSFQLFILRGDVPYIKLHFYTLLLYYTLFNFICMIFVIKFSTYYFNHLILTY